MTDQIKNILFELQEATSKLSVLRDLFQNKLDYFNDADRKKISDFNAAFEEKKESIDRKINSFSRFIEKSFAPSHEELLKTKALEKLHTDYHSFDDFNDAAKQALIEREMHNLKDSTQEKSDVKKEEKEPRKLTDKTASIDNPEPEKPFQLTDDFLFCRPLSFDFKNVKYEVKSWADIFRIISTKLYTESAQPITDYIASNSDKRPFAANQPDGYLRPLQIAENIYVETNLSANNMMKSCRKMLDIYQINLDEVKIYLSKISAK